jgi:hypothetical protein
MTRRDANWLILRAAAAAGGHEFFQSWLSAAQILPTPAPHTHERNATAPPEPDRWTSYQPAFFSPEQFEILDAFTAILIPSDETPGAREAHVAAFTDFVVNASAEYAPQMQKQWRAAMDYLNTQKFGQLTAGEQLSFVKQISEPEHDPSKEHPGFPAYRLIKEMAVHAFYTSRAGLVDALEYKGVAYLTEFPACNHPEHHKV